MVARATGALPAATIGGVRMRAELLRDGGHELIERLMDELGEAHLGLPLSHPDRPRSRLDRREPAGSLEMPRPSAIIAGEQRGQPARSAPCGCCAGSPSPRPRVLRGIQALLEVRPPPIHRRVGLTSTDVSAPRPNVAQMSQRLAGLGRRRDAGDPYAGFERPRRIFDDIDCHTDHHHHADRTTSVTQPGRPLHPGRHLRHVGNRAGSKTELIDRLTHRPRHLMQPMPQEETLSGLLRRVVVSRFAQPRCRRREVSP